MSIYFSQSPPSETAAPVTAGCPWVCISWGEHSSDLCSQSAAAYSGALYPRSSSHSGQYLPAPGPPWFPQHQSACHAHHHDCTYNTHRGQGWRQVRNSKIILENDYNQDFSIEYWTEYNRIVKSRIQFHRMAAAAKGTNCILLLRSDRRDF